MAPLGDSIDTSFSAALPAALVAASGAGALECARLLLKRARRSSIALDTVAQRGNALHAAVTLCEHVDVYGAGLHSAGVAADKIYAHAYDERVGACLEPGSRPYKFGKLKGILGFFQWRKDRVRTEMLLHVLRPCDVQSFGACRWPSSQERCACVE